MLMKRLVAIKLKNVPEMSTKNKLYIELYDIVVH